MNEQEAAVDVVEIARILNISSDTVYRKARTGEIPGFKLGGLWRFFPSEVKAHLRAGVRNRTPAEAPITDPWGQSVRSRSRKRYYGDGTYR